MICTPLASCVAGGRAVWPWVSYVAMGKLCGHGQAMWLWASLVAVSKLYTAGKLYATGELYIAGEPCGSVELCGSGQARGVWVQLGHPTLGLAQMLQWPTAAARYPSEPRRP